LLYSEDGTAFYYYEPLVFKSSATDAFIRENCIGRVIDSWESKEGDRKTMMQLVWTSLLDWKELNDWGNVGILLLINSKSRPAIRAVRNCVIEVLLTRASGRLFCLPPALSFVVGELMRDPERYGIPKEVSDQVEGKIP
jgi:hypothetical protein